MGALWTAPEIDLLRRFYPVYPARLLERAMPRSRGAIHKFALRSCITARQESWKADIPKFWAKWRSYTLSQLPRWLESVSEKEADRILRVILIPAESRSCRDCSYNPACHDLEFAPCQSYSVERWLCADSAERKTLR